MVHIEQRFVNAAVHVVQLRNCLRQERVLQEVLSPFEGPRDFGEIIIYFCQTMDEISALRRQLVDLAGIEKGSEEKPSKFLPISPAEVVIVLPLIFVSIN